MKGKVLTSLGFGLPCVATSIAGEGIGLTDRENILLANSTEELAARVVEVYSDEKLWSKLSGNGMAFIDQNYSPQRVRIGIADILGSFGLPNGTTRVSQSRVPAASPSR
jgi:glycosyltransferase involved in cell wall biosynthesis